MKISQFVLSLPFPFQNFYFILCTGSTHTNIAMFIPLFLLLIPILMSFWFLNPKILIANLEGNVLFWP